MFMNTDDAKFEFHYEIINDENQVQIYEFVISIFAVSSEKLRDCSSLLKINRDSNAKERESHKRAHIRENREPKTVIQTNIPDN